MEYIDFTVEGSGEFPFDMLRYDACWPKRQEDAAKMAPGRHAGYGNLVTLCIKHADEWESKRNGIDWYKEPERYAERFKWFLGG